MPDDEDEVTRALLDALRAIVDGVDAVRRFMASVPTILSSDWNGDKWAPASILALAGISSPLTGGWGSAYLQDHDALVLLPLILIAPFLGRAFPALIRETSRDSEQIKAESAVIEDCDEWLATDAAKRDEVAGRLSGPVPPLHELPMTKEVLDEASERVRAVPGGRTLALVLVRAISGHRFESIATRGPVDDPFAKEMVWERRDVFHGERPFESLAAACAYRSTFCVFHLWEEEYFLLGLSTSAISDPARLRISRAATTLVMRAVYGDALPDWESMLAVEPLRGRS